MGTKLLAVFALVLAGPAAHAQFTNNFQTNNISGLTSNWMGNGTYVVGSNTFFDTLIIQNGGVLSNGTGYIGYETGGSNNAAIVSGSTSAWSNNLNLYIGYQGAGNRLVISNGAQVVNSNAFIGTVNAIQNTNNLVLVSGPGSVWTNSGGLSIGALSAGNELIISNGAKVIDQGLDVGDNSGASTNGQLIDNSALVTGTNSTWIHYGFVGLDRNSPGNVLTVANGGQFFADNSGVYIGNSAASDGLIVLVTDSGSTWTNTGILGVGGYASSNQFVVSNGASAYSGTADVGDNSAVVTGPGSIWTVGGSISVGSSTGGFLIMTNGGVVATPVEFISDGGPASLIIAGGTNEVFSQVVVGCCGGETGTVSVLSGALFVTNALAGGQVTINSNSTLVLGSGLFQADNLTVLPGGAVEYVQTYVVSNASVTVAGGTVQADSSYVVAPSANSTGSVTVASGQLVATNGVIGVGNDGTTTNGLGVGSMTVSNGTVLGSSILLGSSAGGQGQLTVQTNGLVSLVGTGAVLVANDITVDGGDVEIDNGIIYCGETHPGAMTMSNGTANAQITYVGYDSQGTLTMVAGQMTVSSLLDIGFAAGSTGSVWMSGGQFTATTLPTIIGNSGVGQMSISNGIAVLANVVVGNAGNPGMLTLAGGTLTLDTLVLPNTNSRFNFTGGWLNALGITNSNGQVLTLGNGVSSITLNLLGGISSFGNGLQISADATLTGFGTINGSVLNAGLMVSGGGTLTFTGIVTNNGILRANGGSVLESYGTVVNNGTIDAINGTTDFHGAFINNGTVLNASSVRASQVGRSGPDFVVQIPSLSGHTYQLQFVTSLVATNWTNTAAPQSGTGGVLFFTDSGGATNLPARFYRVGVTAP